MKNKYPIEKTYFHKEIRAIDLPNIAQKMTREQFLEFYLQFVFAIDDAKEDPYRPNTELKHDLTDTSRLDFHSKKKPERKEKRDYRFVYRYDRDRSFFFGDAVGLRNAKGEGGDSIYWITKERDRSDENYTEDPIE
ncbi:hypothetical protein [Peribacillus simplex]|uniref:hypothetical protein n=1 Tax=Peribacillus simplex TaxID=1478 RepID=UPI0024C1CE6A|nr:hypothetical protein [Peribacillus simplex]WHY58627.1 hypothetical protein QNH43_10380 [Peribacillus simplex]